MSIERIIAALPEDNTLREALSGWLYLSSAEEKYATSDEPDMLIAFAAMIEAVSAQEIVHILRDCFDSLSEFAAELPDPDDVLHRMLAEAERFDDCGSVGLPTTELDELAAELRGRMGELLELGEKDVKLLVGRPMNAEQHVEAVGLISTTFGAAFVLRAVHYLARTLSTIAGAGSVGAGETTVRIALPAAGFIEAVNKAEAMREAGANGTFRPDRYMSSVGQELSAIVRDHVPATVVAERLKQLK